MASPRENDVANAVSLLKVDAPAVPLMETSCPQLESDTKFLMFIASECPDVKFCVKDCARGVQGSVHSTNAQGKVHLQIYLTDKASAKVPLDFVCSFVFREDVEIKCAMGADAAWALIAVPTQSKGMLKQSGKYRWAYLR